MQTYLNRAAVGTGTVLGAAQGTVATTGNLSLVIINLVPLIVELAIVILMLTMVMKMLGKLGK
tara:strand:+ start:175 stop:363 length:189 start_codon:yes stop_codon:yes gene_type:complete